MLLRFLGAGKGKLQGGWRPWEEALCWKKSGRHGWEKDE
jgi:hypothetical protein